MKAARGHTFHVWTSHHYLDLPDARLGCPAGVA